MLHHLLQYQQASVVSWPTRGIKLNSRLHLSLLFCRCSAPSRFCGVVTPPFDPPSPHFNRCQLPALAWVRWYLSLVYDRRRGSICDGCLSPDWPYFILGYSTSVVEATSPELLSGGPIRACFYGRHPIAARYSGVGSAIPPQGKRYCISYFAEVMGVADVQQLIILDLAYTSQLAAERHFSKYGADMVDSWQYIKTGRRRGELLATTTASPLPLSNVSHSRFYGPDRNRRCSADW